ncbi:MAG: ADP-ribosylation factor-like protein [Promethearchaeota archaeon]
MALSSDVDKLILAGLAESGKTTILKVVSEGYVPDKKAPYSATMDYTRKKFSHFGQTLTVFDLGGQKAFLDRFMGDLAKFIFSNVKILVYVVDIVNVKRFSLSKNYLDLALKRIKQYSPQAAAYVFLHKVDLLEQVKLTQYCNKVKTYLSTELAHPVRFYETSVFSESIFGVFKDIITSLAEEGVISLNTIITEFVKENPDLVTMVQVLNKEGTALIDSASFSHVSPSATHKILNTTLQYLINRKEPITSTFFETKDNVYFVCFLEKSHVLLLGFSQVGLTAKQVSVSTIHHRVLLLTQQLNRLFSQ